MPRKHQHYIIFTQKITANINIINEIYVIQAAQAQYKTVINIIDEVKINIICRTHSKIIVIRFIVTFAVPLRLW